MARVLIAVALASSVGCAQLAGIDNTNNTGRTDSVAVTRMSVGNTVVQAPQDLTGLAATFFVASGSDFTRTPATTGTKPGVWSARLPLAEPVQFTLPDVPTPIPRLFDFPSSALQVLFAVNEHPNPTPAPDGAMLTVSAPLDHAVAAGETFQTYTVGSWTQRGLDAAAAATMVGPETFAFNTSTNISGHPQLDKLTAQDAFFVLRYAIATLTGVAEATPFEQMGNDTVTLPAMTPVTLDQKLDVTIDPMAFTQRYMAARPAVNTLQMNWSLVAAPAFQIASTQGPVLLFGGFAATDAGVTTMYGNPFIARNWHTIFTLQTTESRVFTATGGLPVTLFAGMTQFLEPTSAQTALDLPAGLPKLVSIEGSQLTVDGQTISVPQHFVEVTFETDNPNATIYQLEVFDLLPNAPTGATALQEHETLVAVGSQPKFELPPETFQLGHSYSLRAFAVFGGFPGVATGDFTKRELPTSQAFLDSAVFTVIQ